MIRDNIIEHLNKIDINSSIEENIKLQDKHYKNIVKEYNSFLFKEDFKRKRVKYIEKLILGCAKKPEDVEQYVIRLNLLVELALQVKTLKNELNKEYKVK